MGSFKGWRDSLLFLTILVVGGQLSWAQERDDRAEVEITGDWMRSIEPSLANSEAAAKLDIYDRLAFGKARFARIDGRSRKSVLLMLEGEAKFLVRLFDLPAFDLKTLSPKVDYYFGGILSKVERNAQGGIEVSVMYSNLSEVAGRFYSRQAREFAIRTQEMKQRNQALIGKSGSEPPVSPQPAQSAAVPRAPAASPPQAQAKPEPVKSPESADDAGEPEQPRNPPVLKRRTRSDSDPAVTTGAHENPATLPNTSQPGDDDVVIYRRRDGSRRPSKSSGNAESPSVTEQSSDRPILRRQPDKRELAREVDGMMMIPEGNVTLGSDDPKDSEMPLHHVRVKPFYVDKHEVTNEDYKQFCEATGHRVPPYWQEKGYPKGLEKHPVVQVSWLDAAAYARWAGKRLPTEAEWERAAKGPNSYRFSYGNSYDPQKANTGSQKTSAAGTYPANEFGLFDMTGNASEWTSSLYLPYPYSDADGREDLKAQAPRALRGGDFSSDEKGSRCLTRDKELPDHGSPKLGFRCARDAS